jgi:glycerophosphoryl diester phosphodiesterase
MNWNTINPPLIFAHRGAAGQAPENTLASFRLALEQHCDVIELDIHLSKDNQIVVCHDESVTRTSNGSGLIRGMTAAEIKKLDAGSWFDPKFAEEKMPLLSEVFELVPSEIGINIELKKDYGGQLQLLIELVRHYNRMDSVIFSSFDHKLLYRLKQMTPEAKVSLVYDCKMFDPVQMIRHFGEDIYSIHANYLMIDKEDIAAVRQNGQHVIVWTCNRAEEIKTLFDMGVSGVITDYISHAKNEIRTY